MFTRSIITNIALLVFFIVLAGLASGISLLDDDWGHLKLASKGMGFIWTTGWEGLTGQGGYYRPVVVFSFYLDYLINGYNPSVYHITNVLIHAVCTYFVFLLASCLQMARHVAWGSSILFCVLPIHTDSVYWIVGRTDSLCALFYLATLILFIKYLSSGRWQLLCGIAICSSLAFLSKEMALSLPLAIGGLVIYHKAWKTVEAQRGVGAVCGILLVYFAVRWMVLGSVLGGTPRVSFWHWGVDGVKAIAKMGMTDLKWFGIAVVVVSVGIFIFEQGRGILKVHKAEEVPFCRSFALLLVFLLAISLAPALGHLHNWYLYLPSAFFCMGLGVVWLDKKRKFLFYVYGGLVLYFALVMVREGLFWRETSQVSEALVAELIPYTQKTSGDLVVLNVPAAWTPQQSLSGKPLFAYALKNAVAMRASKPLTSDIVMGNHVWLTGDLDCDVAKVSGGVGLAIKRGGFFSFHGKGAGQVPPFELVHDWGTVRVFSDKLMSVRLDTKPEDCVVVYNQGKFYALMP